MILEYTLQEPNACISKIYKKGMNQFFYLVWGKIIPVQEYFSVKEEILMKKFLNRGLFDIQINKFHEKLLLC